MAEGRVVKQSDVSDDVIAYMYISPEDFKSDYQTIGNFILLYSL